MIQRKDMAKGTRKGVLLRLNRLFLLAFVLVSCDATVYHHFQPVDNEGWCATDTLTYVYEPSSESSAGSDAEVVAQVRYGAKYRYRNLALRIETMRACDSVLLSVDTLCCRMYDERGRRLGATAGAMYQNSSNAVVIPASLTDTLLLKLSHIMAGDTIKELFDVGLRLSAASK